MRNDKLVPGLILVIIGAIFLLNNFGYINFHWSNLWHLWPMILVIGGVNLVFAHNRSPWATALKIFVVLLGFGLLLFGDFGYKRHFFLHGPMYFHNQMDNDDDDSNDNDDSMGKNGVTKIEGSSNFNEPYAATIHQARLNISGGGTRYVLNDTTSQLFNATTKEFFGRYEFTHHQEDSVYVLDFRMQNHKDNHFNWDGNHKSNSADIRLNPNPQWDINVDAGATELNFDLSKFKVKNLKISGGAASFNVKIGQPLASTNVTISTGVSEVNISVPQNAACRIDTESGLSSNTFDGFNKQPDGHFETSGFDAAKNKIYIHMRGGISDFKVHKY